MDDTMRSLERGLKFIEHYGSSKEKLEPIISLTEEQAEEQLKLFFEMYPQIESLTQPDQHETNRS